MRRLENPILTKVVLAAVMSIASSTSFNAEATPSGGLLRKAQTLLDQHQDRAALTCLNTLIKEEPNNAHAYSERSRAHDRVGNYDDAIKDSNKAITLDPNLAVAYAYRANAFIRKGNYSEALADTNKAITLEPKLAIAYGMRASLYERREQYQKELEDCNKAIAINPKYVRYYIDRATAFRELGQYKSALQDCNKALSLDSTQAMSYIRRGYIYFCLGRFQTAADDYAAAIKISPNATEGYLLRADVYGKLGQIQKRIDDLTTASKITPDNAEIYERRAFAYYRLGKLRHTIDDCSRAISLNAASSHAYFTAALAYEDFGLYDKAVELRTELLGFEKKNPFHWSNRASDYEFLGKFDQAQTDRRKAFALASPSEQFSIQLHAPLIDFNQLSGERPKENIDKQLKNSSIVLPFCYDDGGGHISVPAEVNGHLLQLMLDTGNSHSELWKQAMPGVAKIENAQLKDTKANGDEYFFGFFRARDLKLGNLTLPNVAMAVDDGLVKHKTICGFLGGNILENFVVTVDYTKKEIILATSFKVKATKKPIVVPMIMIQDHRPCCCVKLNGKSELVAVLDTGSPSSMIPDSLIKPIQSTKLIYNHHASGTWMGDMRIARGQVKSLTLGSFDFKPPMVDVFPAEQAPNAASYMILGNDFLSSF